MDQLGEAGTQFRRLLRNLHLSAEYDVYSIEG